MGSVGVGTPRDVYKRQVILVETLRQPKLSIRIESGPEDISLRDGRKARWVHVIVTNESLPRWAMWLKRDSATLCRATVQFMYFDGRQDVFGRSMVGRWSNTPQPIQATIVMEGKTFKINDPQRTAQLSIDIPPGESERLDVAVRYSDNDDAYGWNNEPYFNHWESPWPLPKGRYFVLVTVRSSGQKAMAEFYLDNNQGLKEFRLENSPAAKK